MKYITTILTAILLHYSVNAQTEISGIVQTKDGAPIIGATVSITDQATKKTERTLTDENGQFKLKGKAGDKILIHFIGFQAVEIELTQEQVSKGIKISLDDSLSAMEDVVVVGMGSVSPKSYWIGAKVGYNFDGFSDDDADNYFIGAAKVILNQSDNPFLKGEWGVIGNIAGFISNQDKKEASENKEKLTLSVQGLGVGLYQLWKQKVGGNKNVVREYLTVGYRLNTFKKVGKDSITVNLSQFKATAGCEFEAINFKKGGAMSFAIEVSHLRFDENRYESVFGEKKKTLTSLEIGAILPINTTLGFFTSGTFSPSTKPVYLFGIIVRSDSK